MNPFERDLPIVYLKPGEMHFTDQPTLVITVLGSCLSVTMFHRRTGLGGMCHGLLPKCGGQEQCSGACIEGFKFVDCSIRRMAELFDRYDVRRREIEVKCFGGADMFSRELITAGKRVSIGTQNVQTAEGILSHEGLSIVAMDVGGMQGRKLFFYTDTGQVLLKRLMKSGDAPAT